jgi:hypothetical protein
MASPGHSRRRVASGFEAAELNNNANTCISHLPSTLLLNVFKRLPNENDTNKEHQINFILTKIETKL